VGELDTGNLEALTTSDIAQMLRDLRTDPYTWQQPAGARGGHFSLAGAQTKFALHRTADGWARPSGRIPTTHIFKPAIPGIAHHDLNEHLCLQAAQRLGLLPPRPSLPGSTTSGCSSSNGTTDAGSTVSCVGCTRSTCVRPSA
ncbi:MAG: hypothetical protein E4H05_04875, partial [Acidimicrobiales bacterium]